MRILMTTDTVGGVWSFSLQLTEELLCAGSSVALVSLGRLPSEIQERSCTALTETHGDRFTYIPLNVPLEWMNGNEEAYRLAEPILMSISRNIGAELLHSNQFCFGALPIQVPKLITAHSDVMSWAKSCRGGLLENTPWLRRYRELVQDGLSQASAVTAPTAWMLRSLGGTYTLPDTQLVIPNGCSVQGMTSDSFALQAVTAGRLWDEGKGISIFKEVTSPMPLLIAGETEYGGRATPEFFRGPCRLLGPVEHQDLLELFSQSAIYICPSIYEPFGLAPLEAAMCRCAILARDIPSLREVWGDGAMYFSEAASLSSTLERLHRDSAMLERLREKSRARASEFSLARMTQQYLRLYKNLTGTGASKAHAA
jgi:glycogen(starch) synthase